jgi:hypothetical protein
MAGIWSVHTALDAEAILARVRAANARRDDGRLAGERRAEALRDLVLGNQQTDNTRGPAVQLVVPIDVALGVSDMPGELVGYGPIPASVCREAVCDPMVTIRRLVIGPLGELRDCATSYRPSKALTDRIVGRDRTCRFPHCNRKAEGCELDHITPFNGRNTTEANLHALCRRHHHLKHEAGWRVRRREGTTEWTSPTGRHYVKGAERYLANDADEVPP